MATPTASRPGRGLIVLVALIALLVVGIFATAPGSWWSSVPAKFKPKLGLDLEGGTSVILQPRVPGGGKPSTTSLNEAVNILRQRVDGLGVTESEVATEGDNIVISVPGREGRDVLQLVGQTAELRFRQVLAVQPGNATPTPTPTPTTSGTAKPSPAGTAKPSPGGTASPKPSPAPTSGSVIPKSLLKGATTPAPTPSATPLAPTPTPTAPGGNGALTAQLQAQFQSLDCSDLGKLRQTLQQPGADVPDKPLVTCEQDGSFKYLLGPAEVVGTDVKTASATLETNSQGAPTGGWQVELAFTGGGAKKFAQITSRLATQQSPMNQFGIVLDGLVVSAPQVNEAIPGGRAQITGNFTQKTASDLANVLKYGALPLTFNEGQVQEVSPTLGSDSLRAGVLAGLLGLLVVVLYLFVYYRGLGIVSVASLAVAALLTFLSVVFLGNYVGFRLSLAGVAGLIVAIGITADSFIVYFERLRDEVREGRTLRVAVESGWVRARRTILSADAISMLAAAVLYVLSVGSVRGFAFTLGLTTLIDIIVVFVFTKPLVTLLARTKFFGGGHRWSGLSPDRLGTQRRAPSEALLRRPRAAGVTRSATKEA